MKAAILIAAMAASFGANATNCQGNCPGGDTTNNYNTTNEYKMSGGAGGQGGTGLGIGVGIGQGGDAKAYGGNANSNSGVYGSGNSTVKTDNTNLNAQGQQQGQLQGQNQTAQGGASSSTSAGGTASAAGGQGSGNSTSVTFGGNTYREAAQSAYAPTPSGPRTSCRLFIGLGGSSREGALSGGIPLQNDQLCVSGAQVEFMQTVNKVQPGTFKVDDYLQAVCLVEGMEKMAACIARK